MSSNNETLAGVTRFVSVAVLTCLLMTGGMWLYHNRVEIVAGTSASADGGSQSGNWFTRWAGVDTTRLNVDDSHKLFPDQPPALPAIQEFDTEWTKQFHQPVQVNWDR